MKFEECSRGKTEIDVITYEVIRNRMAAITEEMRIALT